MAQQADRLQLERQRIALNRDRAALNRRIREAQAHDNWQEQHNPLPAVERVWRKVGSTAREAVEAPDEDILLYQQIVDPQQMPIRERPKLKTYGERKAWAKLQQNALIDAFKNQHPGYSDTDIRHAIADARRSYNAFVRGPPKVYTDEEKAARQAAREALADYRMDNPTGIWDPDHKMDAVLAKFKGSDDYDNEFIEKGSRFRHDDRRREYFGKVFAELTGVAGLMPKFNSALTTVESAAEIFPPEDYDIQAYDMDSDANTPYTVIIRKKLRNRKGELTGKVGPIIAANGYYLPENTPSMQLRRLRQMDWMKENPTKLARRITPYGVYISQSKALGKEAVAFKALTEFVRDYFATGGFIPPRPDDPALIKGSIPVRDKTETIYYKLAGPAWNSLISNVARLFGMYFVLPYIRDILLKPMADQLPKHNLPGERFTDTNIYLRITTNDPDKALVMPWRFVGGRDKDDYMSNLAQLWKQFMIHPKVERLVYNHRLGKVAMANALVMLRAGAFEIPDINDPSKPSKDYSSVFIPLVGIVCFCFMNWQFGEIITRFGGTVSASEAKLFGDPDVMARTFPAGGFTLVNRLTADGLALANQIRAQTAGKEVNHPINVLNMTAKKHDTIIKESQVVERGTDLIAEPLNDEKLKQYADNIRLQMHKRATAATERPTGTALTRIAIPAWKQPTEDNSVEGEWGTRADLFQPDGDFSSAEWDKIRGAPSKNRTFLRSSALEDLRKKGDWATSKTSWLSPYTPTSQRSKLSEYLRSAEQEGDVSESDLFSDQEPETPVTKAPKKKRQTRSKGRRATASSSSVQDDEY